MTSTFEFCPDMATNEAVTVKVETCVDTPVCDAKDRADGLLMNLKQEPSPSFDDIQQQATFQVNRKARNQHISVANQNHCHSDGNSSCKSQARATLDTFRTTPTIQRPIQPKPSPKYFSSMFHMPKGQNPDVLKQHHLGAWHWQASQWPTSRRTSNKRVYSRSRDKTYLSGNEPRIPCFPPRKKNSKSRRSSAKDERANHQYLGYNPQALRLCASLFGEKYGYNLKPRITSISELRNLPNTATPQHSGHQNSPGYFNVSLGALDQPDALSGYYATPCATSGSGLSVPNARAPGNPESPPEPRRKSYSLVSCHSGYNQPDYTHPVVDYRVAQTAQNSPCGTMYIPQNINQNISKHIPKVNIRRLTQHKSSCDVNHQKTSSRPVHRNSVRDGCHEEPLDLRVKPVKPTEGQQYSTCADSNGGDASTSNPGFFNFENTQTANVAVRENQVDGNISRQDTIDTRAADEEYELCDDGYMEIKPLTEVDSVQNEPAIAIIPNKSEKEQILINTNESTSVPSHQATIKSCDGVSCEEVEIAFSSETLKESHDASEAERKTDDDKRPIGDVTSKCAVNERDLLYELLKLRLVNTGQHKNSQVTKRKRGRPPKSKNRTIEPYKMDLQELYSSLRYPQRKRNRTKKFEIAIHKPKSRKKRGRPRVSQKTIMAEHNERKKRNMYQQEWRLKRKGLTAGSSDDELQQSRDDERQTDETYYDDEHKTEEENYGCGQKAGETVYGVVYRSDGTDDDDETWGKEKNSNEEQLTESTDSSDENQTDGADYEDQLQTDEDDYASGSESDKDDYKSDSQADGTDYDSEQYTDDQDYNDEHQTAEKYYDDEHHQQDGICCNNEPQNDLKEEQKTVGVYHNDKGEPDGTDNLGQWSPYFNNTDVLPNQKVSDCAYPATGPSGDVNRKCTVTDLPCNVNWEPVVILDRLDTETLRKCSS